jgi:hypothetical protein
MVGGGSVPYRARARRDCEPAIHCLRQRISPISPISPTRGIAPIVGARARQGSKMGSLGARRCRYRRTASGELRTFNEFSF